MGTLCWIIDWMYLYEHVNFLLYIILHKYICQSLGREIGVCYIEQPLFSHCFCYSRKLCCKVSKPKKRNWKGILKNVCAFRVLCLNNKSRGKERYQAIKILRSMSTESDDEASCNSYSGLLFCTIFQWYSACDWFHPW